MVFQAVVSGQDEAAGSPAPAGRIRELRLARLRRDPETYLLTRAVARSRGLTLRQVLAGGRGTAKAAAARQLAMYLAHVLLGRPQDVVGRLFGRHASTVSHACRVIEDRRDNPPLEREIADIERALAADVETSRAA